MPDLHWVQAATATGQTSLPTPLSRAWSHDWPTRSLGTPPLTSSPLQPDMLLRTASVTVPPRHHSPHAQLTTHTGAPQTALPGSAGTTAPHAKAMTLHMPPLGRSTPAHLANSRNPQGPRLGHHATPCWSWSAPRGSPGSLEFSEGGSRPGSTVSPARAYKYLSASTEACLGFF